MCCDGKRRRTRRNVQSNALRASRRAEDNSGLLYEHHHKAARPQDPTHGHNWRRIFLSDGFMDKVRAISAGDILHHSREVKKLPHRQCRLVLLRGRPEDKHTAPDNVAQPILELVTRELATSAGTCPTCGGAVGSHIVWEVYFNVLEPQDFIDWHTDEPGPDCELGDATVLVLIQAAANGGLLNIAKGNCPVHTGRGSHVARSGHTPLLRAADGVIMNGKDILHRVGKVIAGRRLSLVIGIRCPHTDNGK